MDEVETYEYNKLSQDEKEFYNMAKRSHPDWNHGQAVVFAIIAGLSVQVQQPLASIKETFSTIVERALEIIKDNFPRIYQEKKLFEGVKSIRL